jgi:adenosylmethionine-8-amino-7-oxononanoate aminotransferase
MQGIEFVRDKNTKEPFPPEVMFSTKLLMTALENGLGVLTSSGCADGQKGDLVLLGPPFTISEDEIDQLVDKLDRVISILEKKELNLPNAAHCG